jgi:hypothetical protein
MRREVKFVVGAAVAALVASTVPVSAHVTVGIQTLRETTLTYRAPVEPTPTTPEQLAKHHTNRVVVNLPVGFKVKSCVKTAQFNCSFTVNKVSWTRWADSKKFALVDFFDVVVLSPGVGGTYRTPALQVYSDGVKVNWNQPNTTDPHPAPQIRVNGPDRVPRVARGVFKPLSELGGGNPCPQEVIDDAIRLGIDPAVHCGHFGFEPPPGSAPPPPPPNELDIGGTAKLVRGGGQTTVEVRVTGLEPGKVYDAHLHEGTCANVTSPHYKNNLSGPDRPPNELWPSSDKNNPMAGLKANKQGVAVGFGRANWVARPTAHAIWIHAPADPNDPHAHPRIGCAELV